MNRYTPEFQNEDELQAWLKEQFEAEGWRVKREVSPVDSDVRADLLVQHDEYGWIGIECKHMSTPREGKKVGKALEQIVTRYRGREYSCGEVDLWAFCPYFKKDVGQATQTIRELLCHFGVGVIWTHERSLKIDFAYSDSDTKILLKYFKRDIPKDRYGDLQAIRDSVLPKTRIFESESEDICQYNTRGVGCEVAASEIVELRDYEIRLCRHHVRKFDREMAQRRAEADEKSRWGED